MRWLRENLRAVLLAIGVHVAIALPLLFAFDFGRSPAQAMMASAIPAQAISAEEFDRPKREAEARRQEELAQKELARKRKAAEEARRKAEEEQRKQAEAEAQQKKEAEARRQAELEAKKKAEEEARRKAEAEAKRKAEEEARRKAEAEAKRKAEEDARRKAEAKAQAEREAELREAMQAEEQRQAAIAAGKQEEWTSMLLAKAYRYFNPPFNAGSDFYCSVEVRLIPGGDVASVRTTKCDSEQLQRAAENAVWKSAPFPMPSDPSVFSRNVTFVFVPPDTE